MTVRHNKTGELVTIPNTSEVLDAGDDGISYTFKPFQKVHRLHPAVRDAPSAFVPIDEVDTDINPIVEV